MRAPPRILGIVRSAVCLALAVATLPRLGFAREESIGTRIADALGPLESRSRTGVLYDRVLPLAHLERLDGSALAPDIDLQTWRQAYDELRRASLRAPAEPDLDALMADARGAIRDGVIPLALLDRAYERVRPAALTDGSVVIDGGRIARVSGSPLVESRAFAVAALAPRTYRGAEAVFSLDPRRCFSDEPIAPHAVTINFADGRGFRPVALGERVRVRYAETGPHRLAVRLTRSDGSTAEAGFRFDVVALATPSPNDTLHVTATIPYQGQYGTGDAYVYLAASHSAIVNPIVVIEGFDLDNSMNWDELYQLLDQENLIETLRAEGFDAVVLNFTDATEPIQKNAFVVAELVQQVQAAIAPQATIALIGASMGGLCSRYALAYLVTHGVPHRVRTWLSFDAPQAGANIPLGLQYWINFFSGQSADAAAFLAILQRPAARQMLVYHFTDPPGATGQPDPLRAGLTADLAAVGDYPTLTRRVAISNGSGQRANQGFAPADQLIRYQYSSAFVAITGDVWALPDQVSGRIFNGSIRILFSTTSQSATVTGTSAWDGAPGGSRASLAELDSTTATYGDIVALHPSHCFIPTVSSLALDTTDPFFDVAGDPDLLAHTPFDAAYFPAANQEHVLITSENAAWVRAEVEQGVLDVSPGGPSHRPVVDAGVPNPFLTETKLGFTLPAAAVADVRVFGADGRMIRTLLHETLAAGRHWVSWDGRDARGVHAPAGLYFLRLAAGGDVATRRIVKLE